MIKLGMMVGFGNDPSLAALYPIKTVHAPNDLEAVILALRARFAHYSNFTGGDLEHVESIRVHVELREEGLEEGYEPGDTAPQEAPAPGVPPLPDPD